MHYGPYSHPALQQPSAVASSNDLASTLPGHHIDTSTIGEVSNWQGPAHCARSTASALITGQGAVTPINNRQWASSAHLGFSAQARQQSGAQLGGRAGRGEVDQFSQQQQQFMCMQQVCATAAQLQAAHCSPPCGLPAYIPCAAASSQ